MNVRGLPGHAVETHLDYMRRKAPIAAPPSVDLRRPSVGGASAPVCVWQARGALHTRHMQGTRARCNWTCAPSFSPRDGFGHCMPGCCHAWVHDREVSACTARRPCASWRFAAYAHLPAKPYPVTVAAVAAAASQPDTYPVNRGFDPVSEQPRCPARAAFAAPTRHVPANPPHLAPLVKTFSSIGSRKRHRRAPVRPLRPARWPGQPASRQRPGTRGPTHRQPMQLPPRNRPQ